MLLSTIRGRGILLGSAMLCFTLAANAGEGDADTDGVIDDIDNCVNVANSDQRDTNADLYGNACDPDLNNDLQINFLDLGIMKAEFFGANADADLDGSGSVNFLDLGIMKSQFFSSPGPSGQVPTYTNDVQAVLQAKCMPCHTTLGFGGHNVATVYADALLPANNGQCTGLTVGACALVRVQSGQMPQGAGCSGNPAIDAGNAACLDQAEQDLLQGWIDNNLPE